MYVWKESTSSFTKLTEFEGLDVTITWASIGGRPASSPTQIDQAVTDRHTHANKGVLDLFSEISGKPAYNGSVIGADWTLTQW
jgi:hypothetical protein